jgi:2'-5' RNA ligase
MGSIAFVKQKARAIVSWLEGAMNLRNKEIFDYEFSGISVWIEPGEAQATKLKETMAGLADKCGGATRGVHEFAPHCTMLYNIPLQSFLQRSSLSSSPVANIEESIENTSQVMLDECVKKYQKAIGDERGIVLKPTSLHFFPFPPFGCVISFLHVELTKELDQMHQIVKGVFPPDERHQTSGKLMPHMSLVYAPEAEGSFLMDETKRLTVDKNGASLLEPMRAKYLSVWNTEGKTSDWKRIAKVELPCY